MKGLLRAEGVRTALTYILALAMGQLWDAPWLWLTLASTGLLCLHLYYAGRLMHWAAEPKKRDLPDGSGIWRGIYAASLNRYRQARKRKKRLAGMLAEFRASTAALPDAAVVLDPQGQISWFNGAAAALLGLSSGKDLGQRINNLLRHPDFTAYCASFAERREGVEIPSPVMEGGTLLVRLIPYGRQQRLLIARDITVFKRLEETRRDFVANASHELRTPLTVVRGYLEMMGDELDAAPVPGKWAEPVRAMRKQAARMQQIVHDLLTLAALEDVRRPAAKEVLDMPQILLEALQEAQRLSDGEHRFVQEIEPELNLYGTAGEIRSVVANLLGNAVRYTPAGGTITLQWERCDGQAVLRVSDSGIGIPARDIPRLTERFYRSDVARSRETGGTGLGLAIVKHALERHQAELRIDSTVGRGSTFICIFPAVRSPLSESSSRA